MAAAPNVNEAASVLGKASAAAQHDPIASERARLRKLVSDDRKLGVLFKSIWRGYRPLTSDPREYIERVWSRKLPKVYERMLAASLAGERVPDMALDLLKSMTVMCRTLAPQANKQLPADPTLLGLPSDADLSHLSDEDLAKVLRRPVPGNAGAVSRKPRRKALPQPDVPMGGLDDDDERVRSGTQHAHGLSQDGTVHTQESGKGRGKGEKKRCG